MHCFWISLIFVEWVQKHNINLTNTRNILKALLTFKHQNRYTIFSGILLSKRIKQWPILLTYHFANVAVTKVLCHFKFPHLRFLSNFVNEPTFCCSFVCACICSGHGHWGIEYNHGRQVLWTCNFGMVVSGKSLRQEKTRSLFQWISSSHYWLL